ncbi:MAG: lipoprotein signal peptidase [Betaproteobacteria bacterium]|nr:lipoprotein signal peptidase [Betaproteobacteria bacterium]
MRKWFFISAVVVALDLYTKHLIQQAFVFGEHLSIASFFDLVRFHNTGAAFSFLADESGWQKWFFTTITAIAVMVITYLIRKHHQEKLFCWGLALVLGGAVGNLYDRLTLGYVVDFIFFHIDDLYWPAFNVADSAICVGIGLLLLDSFKKEKQKS